MKWHKNIIDITLKNPVVTLGNFDGVHLGHMALLKALKLKAELVDGESVVVTFDPHPAIALGKKSAQLLSDTSEKIYLLEISGVNHLLSIDFTEEFAKQSACDFIRDTLVQKLGIHTLFLGYDNRFGWRADGNDSGVEACAQKFGFRVERFGVAVKEESTISSTLIRSKLLEGDLKTVNRLLGYDFNLAGSVVGGKQIGRDMGFPTANIEPMYSYKMVPGDGVYAVHVQLGGSLLPGMLNIGNRPTLRENETTRSIEVNIFNFDRDIYGENVRLFFRHRIRDEMRFESLDDLIKQLIRDREESIRLIGPI